MSGPAARPPMYHHVAECEWFRKHRDFRSVGADGVPRVLDMDPETGATISRPCGCWTANPIRRDRQHLR